jgi:predicted phosphodiesterase
MRVAVISDLHGNLFAIDAVLEDIRRQGADRIVCAGDIVNPFLGSLEAWQLLKGLKIPCVRGNHEDYMRAYYDPSIRPEVRDAVHFRPSQLVARHLGEELSRELAALPLTMTIPGPSGDDLFICHASPSINNRSYWLGIDDAMAADLKQVEARTIVAGHMHLQWSRAWEDKTLVVAGSVGLPLSSKPRPEYTMLDHRDGRWHVEPRTVAYDQRAAVDEFVERGCAKLGGPIGWMLLDELWSAEARLFHFLPRMGKLPGGLPQDLETWEREAEAYLRELGRWEAISDRVRSCST